MLLLGLYSMLQLCLSYAMRKENEFAASWAKRFELALTEKAFYDALEQNESSLRDLGDEILKKIAQELREYLRKSAKIDWTKRESVRAAIKIQIKRILRKYKYPPDKQAEAIERVLEQAERVSDEQLIW